MAGPEEPAAASPRRASIWPRAVLSLVLALGFAWMLRRGGLPMLPSRDLFARVGPGAMAVYTLWFSLVWLVRAHRWAYLLRPLAEIPKRESLAVGLVGAAAVVLAPLRLGELARPYLIDGRGVRFAQGAGIVGAERVVDGVVLASLLMLGLLGSTALSPLPDHLGDLPMPVAAIPRAAWTSLAIFACAFLAMAAFYFARERASRVVHTLVGAVSPRLATFVATSVARVADGLTFLAQPRHALPYLRDTVVYWLMNVAGLFYVMRAGGLPATPAHAAVLMGVLSLGIMVPSGPGFFGAFQLSAYCGLALFFPLPQVVAEGSAIVFVLYASQTLVAIVFGLLGLLALPATTQGRPIDRTSLGSALLRRKVGPNAALSRGCCHVPAVP